MMTYEELVLRNGGYVPPGVQETIRRTPLLIAGCGLGSSIAEAAVRMGFESLTLVDGDTVSAHNLNRQAFTAADVGSTKVAALARRLRAINPGVKLREVEAWVDGSNAAALVAEAGLVFDTIDFLSLSGIVALHDRCQRERKPVVSALNVAWGAAAICFLPGGCTFRELFGLPATGSVDNESYTKHFRLVIERLAEVLDPEVIAVVGQALQQMEDGRPCPAPQLAAGASANASLALTLGVRILRGLKVTAAPEMVLVNPSSIAVSSGIDLRPR